MERNNSNYTTVAPDWQAADESYDRYKRYELIVYAYVGGPLILAGLIGNIIATCTLRKLKRQNVTIFLLRGLAFVDISVLLGYAVLFTCCCVDSCKIRIDTPHVLFYIGAIFNIFISVNIWMTVMVGMNRYIALCRPLDAQRLCTTSRAKKHMIYIVLVSIVFELPGFFVPSPHNKWYVYIFDFGYNQIALCLIPFSMLLFFTVRIIIALRASRRQQLGRHGGYQVDRKLTSMLLVLLGVFLVCHVFIRIMSLALNLYQFGYRDADFLSLLFGYTMGRVLYVLNSSVNCLIYIVFLKEFRGLLCKQRIHRAQQNEQYELS